MVMMDAGLIVDASRTLSLRMLLNLNVYHLQAFVVRSYTYAMNGRSSAFNCTEGSSNFDSVAIAWICSRNTLQLRGI